MPVAGSMTPASRPCTFACAARRLPSKPRARPWAASARTTPRWRRTGPCAATSACPGSRSAGNAIFGGYRCRRRRRCWTCPSRPWWNGMAASAGCAPSLRTRSACARRPCAQAAMPRCLRRLKAEELPSPRFTPLAAPLDRIHRELKREFDPAGIFNRGRLYPDFYAMQTNSVARIQGHGRGPRGRSHPAQVRALRLLHRDLSYLPDPG